MALELAVSGFQMLRKAYKMAAEAKANLCYMEEELEETYLSILQLEGQLRNPAMRRVLEEHDGELLDWFERVTREARKCHRMTTDKFSPLRKQIQALFGQVMTLNRAAALTTQTVRVFLTAAAKPVEIVTEKVEYLRRLQARGEAEVVNANANVVGATGGPAGEFLNKVGNDIGSTVDSSVDAIGNVVTERTGVDDVLLVTAMKQISDISAWLALLDRAIARIDFDDEDDETKKKANRRVSANNLKTGDSSPLTRQLTNADDNDIMRMAVESLSKTIVVSDNGRLTKTQLAKKMAPFGDDELVQFLFWVLTKNGCSGTGDEPGFGRDGFTEFMKQLPYSPMLCLGGLLLLFIEHVKGLEKDLTHEAPEWHRSALELTRKMALPLTDKVLAIGLCITSMEAREMFSDEWEAWALGQADQSSAAMDAMLEFADHFAACVVDGEMPSSSMLLDLSCAGAHGMQGSVGMSIKHKLHLLRSIAAVSDIEEDLKKVDKWQRKLGNALARLQGLRSSDKMPGSVVHTFGAVCADSESAKFWVTAFGDTTHSVPWTRFQRSFLEYHKDEVSPSDVPKIISRLKKRLVQPLTGDVSVDTVRVLERASQTTALAQEAKARLCGVGGNSPVVESPAWYECTAITSKHIKALAAYSCQVSPSVSTSPHPSPNPVLRLTSSS